MVPQPRGSYSAPKYGVIIHLLETFVISRQVSFHGTRNVHVNLLREASWTKCYKTVSSYTHVVRKVQVQHTA